MTKQDLASSLTIPSTPHAPTYVIRSRQRKGSLATASFLSPYTFEADLQLLLLQSGRLLKDLTAWPRTATEVQSPLLPTCNCHSPSLTSVAASSVASSSGTSMAEVSKPSKEVQKASQGKLKKPPPFPRKNSDLNSMLIVLITPSQGKF